MAKKTYIILEIKLLNIENTMFLFYLYHIICRILLPFIHNIMYGVHGFSIDDDDDYVRGDWRAPI